MHGESAHPARFLLNGVSRVSPSLSRVRGCKTNPNGLALLFIWPKVCGVEILIFIIAGREIHEGWPSTSVPVSAFTARPPTISTLKSGLMICLNSRAKRKRHNSHHHFGRPFSRSSLGAQKIRPWAFGSTTVKQLRWLQYGRLHF